MYLTAWTCVLVLTVVHCYDITIIHTNDVHARRVQMNKYGGGCSKADALANKCFGGLARQKTKVKEIRNANANTLLLDGGDQFMGTLFFYKFAGLGVANFTNHLGYDAMTIGNHEFDKGISGLISFLDAVNFPVVSSNIQLPPNHPLEGKFTSSHVFTVGGERIGVVGYTTKDTPQISSPGADMIFNDEIEAVRKEVASLTEQGINKIIALGHAGFAVDVKIAEGVEGVDIVIGGHDDTFLYTGTKPSNEDPVGEYPHVVTQSSGKKVLCVQDYAFGKYLGELHVTFDDQGQVTSWGGNPILLDHTVVQDANTLTFLEPYTEQVRNETYTVIGRSHVHLNGDRLVCRVQECNMGNLVADAMVKQNLRFTDSLYWNDVAIAFVNSGGIRASMTKGDITIADVATVQPFSNTVDIVELFGKTIIETLEYCASRVNEGDFGGFLQFSGIKVDYDMYEPVGKRVRRVRVLCTKCEVPEYKEIVENEIYKVIMSSFIANGGDGYDIIKNNIIRHHIIGDLDLDVTMEYIRDYSPVTQGLEERIVFSSHNPGCPTTNGGSPLFSRISLFITLIICYLACTN